jgi:hypothetical protein
MFSIKISKISKSSNLKKVQTQKMFPNKKVQTSKLFKFQKSSNSKKFESSKVQKKPIGKTKKREERNQ